jgi:hypothetical protein
LQGESVLGAARDRCLEEVCGCHMV